MPAKPRSKHLVALDWDAHTLRVVHALITKRGLKIDRLLSVAIPSTVDTANPEQMGLHIRRTLDQESITVRHVVVDVPRDQAILKTLKLPTTEPDVLPGMVQIQIAKELPFPVAEAVIDFAVASEARNLPSGDVLVAAVRREVLAHYEATCEVAGLRLERVGLRPYATKIAVEALLRPTMPERVLFIDVRPTFMEIDVLKGTALAFSRSASVSIQADGSGSGKGSILSISGESEPDTPAIEVTSSGLMGESGGSGSSIDELVLEVTRSIEAYRAGDPGAGIDHVVIGGDVGVEEELADAIQKRLDLTTQLYNPASSFGWEPDEGAAASAFAASLGLVLGHADEDTLHFDFLHPKRTVSVVKERLRKAPLVAAVVVLFMAACGVGFAQATKPGRQKLAEIESQISDLRTDKRTNEKFLLLMDRIREFDGEQHVWVDVLYDIISLLPSNQELVLKHIDVNQKEGRVTLKTKTVKRDIPTAILRTLHEFVRDGREGPRFQGNIGPQIQKKGEMYPYQQDLRITILKDKPWKKKSKKPRSGDQRSGD